MKMKELLALIRNEPSVEFKYIMFHVENGLARFIPVIFPDLLAHSQVAEHMLRAMPKGGTWRSAGSVLFTKNGIICSGRSESMNLESHKDDSDIIAMYNYLHGISI